jgi:hypothetical protein
MHCMIAWGSPDPARPLTSDEHTQIEAALQQHEFMRVFPGAGVLTVTDNDQRLAIESELVAVIKAGLQGRVQLLISPPMSPGQFFYRGFLPKGFWERLNKIAS